MVLFCLMNLENAFSEVHPIKSNVIINNKKFFVYFEYLDVYYIISVYLVDPWSLYSVVVKLRHVTTPAVA